jgi:hypothetical protein
MLFKRFVTLILPEYTNFHTKNKHKSLATVEKEVKFGS